MTSETSEPSYYEIALTNRQVLMAFIVVLASIVGAFLSGVYLGHQDPGTANAQELQVAATNQGSGDQLENFRFFTETEAEPKKNPKATLRKPDLSPLKNAESKKNNTPRKSRPAKSRDTKDAKAMTLADAAGTTKSELRTPPPPPPPPRRETTRAAPPPPPPPPPPATKTAEDPKTGFVIQIFASDDKGKADQMLAKVKSAGYDGFLSPTTTDDKTYYRVRIGPFDKRSSAERIARGAQGKLGIKEPWVTAASN